MQKQSPPRKPSFVGQGLLIVLPAIVLVAFGLYSLRQDRLLAEQQGAQLAQQLADALAQSVLPRALDLNLPLASLCDEVEQFIGGGWRRPADEPLSRWGDFLVCLVKPTGPRPDSGGSAGWPYVQVYPPPAAPLPPPVPLDPAGLPVPASTLWQQALAHIRDSQYREAAQDLETFLTNALPEPFPAIARHRLAVCYLRAGNTVAARTNFSALVLNHSEARGETGLPLAPFAQLQLMELDRQATASSRGANLSAPVTTPDISLLNEVGSHALLQPSPFSTQLMDRLCAVAGDYGQVWSRLWTFHERSRDFLELFLAQTNSPKPDESRSLWLENESGRGVLARWVAAGESAGSTAEAKYWLVVWPLERLEEALKASLESQVLPQYLKIGVEVAGVDLTGGPGRDPVLATASGGGSGTIPEFRVSAYLTDRAMLYASLRARRFWFGGLIFVSAGALLVGYLAAWRAFHRQQQLAEMKGNFVSAVSHELRAPIASIRLMSEELEDIGASEPAKSKEYHHLMKQECSRLSSLIDNVLDFSRNEQGRKQYVFQETDLVGLIEETLKVMQPYGREKSIELTAAVHGTPVPVEADGRALQQALVNLLDNAIKHSPEKSTVTVGLDFSPPPTEGDHASRPGEQVSCFKLYVEDHGEGIPPEDHERIFERFYRRGTELRRETQGIGLGLAIVKYVTKAHGGKVTVRSAVGHGSRFTLDLPLSRKSW